MVIKNTKSKLQISKQNQNPKSKIFGVLLLSGFFMMSITNFSFAQDASFTASVDKNTVGLNDEVKLTLTVTGSQDTGSPELPELDGFRKISSGSSSQFSFVNGKMSMSKTFIYLLMPVKEGKFVIPSATIEVSGQLLKTEPINVEVVKGAASTSSVPAQRAGISQQPQTIQEEPISGQDELKDRIFVKVDTDKKIAYIGEQITMTFKLYHRGVSIDNLQYAPPVTKGFITEAMGQQKEFREVVNGVVYDVVELKTAIFPATEGELTIEPAKLKCDLLVRQQRTSRRRSGRDDFFDDFFQDPFFDSYTRYPIALESDPIKIDVKGFPEEDKPDTFNGAIGTFDLFASASPLSLKAGEPINFVMKVSGAGNITQVQEPVIKDLTGFKAYDSEVKIDIAGRDPQIAGQKIFQKMIIPQDDKVKEIPAVEFSYFDPLLKQYKTIRKGPIPITVAPAPKKETQIVELVKQVATQEEIKPTVKLLAKDIQYIQKSPGRFDKINQYWYKNIFLWVVIILIPLIVVGVSAVYVIHKTRLQEDKAYAKSMGAHRTARHLLDEAINYQKQNKPKDFYDAAAKAVQKYISDKLNIPAGSVTTQALDEILAPKGIKIDVINSIKRLMDTCDMVRFGAYSSTQQEMKQIIKEIENIIGILSKKL